MADQSQFLQLMRSEYEESTKKLMKKEQDLYRRIEVLETTTRTKGGTDIDNFEDTGSTSKRRSIDSSSVTFQPPSLTTPKSGDKYHHRLSFNFSRINLFNPELGWPVLPVNQRKLRSISFNILSNRNPPSMVDPKYDESAEDIVSQKEEKENYILLSKNPKNANRQSNAQRGNQHDGGFVLPVDDFATRHRDDSLDQTDVFTPFWEKKKNNQKLTDQIPEKDTPDASSSFDCGCSLNKMPPPLSMSVASLTSQDLENLEKLNVLAMKEKNLSNNIKRLQEREKTLEETINAAKRCECKDEQITQQNEELKTENLLLLTELKEMRMEIRQYIEKMEAPSSLQLKNEQIKHKQLEEQNKCLSRTILEVKKQHLKEVNSIKMQTSVVYGNLTEAQDTNCYLKEEIKRLSDKLERTQLEYVNLKIEEAKVISQIQQEVQLKLIQEGQDDEEEEEVVVVDPETGARKKRKKKKKGKKFVCDKDLGVVTRKLSAAIKEFIPCEECTTLLPDLGVAANQIKELSDMVNKTFGKGGKSEATTEAEEDEDDDEEEEEEVEQEDPDRYKKDLIRKLREESCACVQNLQMLDDALSGGDRPCTCMKRIDLKPPPEKQREPLEPFDPCKCIKQLKTGPDNRQRGPSYPCTCGKPDTTCRCRDKKALTPPKGDYTCKCGRKDPKGMGIKIKKEGKDLSFSKDERTEILRRVEAVQGDTNVKSQTTILNPRNIPVDVDTDVELIDKEIAGVQVITTLTKTGSIQVVTEGPEGIVETKMVYNKQGELEIHTDIVDVEGMKIRQTSGIDGHPPSCVCPHCIELGKKAKKGEGKEKEEGKEGEEGTETDEGKEDEESAKEETEIEAKPEEEKTEQEEAAEEEKPEDIPVDPEVEKEIESLVIGSQPDV